jgi:hypothetical protein
MESTVIRRRKAGIGNPDVREGLRADNRLP